MNPRHLRTTVRAKWTCSPPGLNVLSAVSYSCYFPNIYGPEKRNDTTEYKGLFDGGMKITADSDGNTMFSIYVMNSLAEGSSGYALSGGEVVVDEDGNCSLYGGGYGPQDPIREGQSWADHALTNRAGFLSCVTRTDALKDLCSTGGYIDLTRMGEEAPVITDAVCDLSQKTLTIYGERLSDGYTLKFKRITDESGTEIALPSDDMDVRFAGDGKSVVIGNADELFGSYIEFLLYNSGDVRASRSFFTVKGQDPLEEVYREVSSAGSGSHLTVPAGSKLVTDTEGRAPGTDNEYKNTKIAEVTSKKDVSTINVKGLAKGETTLKIRVNGVWLELEVIVE